MYTNVPKPTGTPYININIIPVYDDLTVLYDDPNVFYDGFSDSAYTDIAKPTYNIATGGIATGLLMPLTFSKTTVTSPYTNVNKPT